MFGRLSERKGQASSCCHVSDLSEPRNRTDRALTCLDQVHPGQAFRIDQVSEGHGLCCKLYGMGLLPGVHLTVVSNAGHGPVVISIQGTRIGLGRGMAGYIWGCVCSAE